MAWEMRYAHRQMAASALMNVMIAAARKAGRGLARDFGEIEQLQVSVKGPGNFVTAADHRSEDTIYKELSKARPGYGFLMEERGLVPGPDKTHRWIVDPLDGTTNFLHGIPLFCHRHGARAGGRDRLRPHLQSDPGRALHGREGPGGLRQQPTPARRRPQDPVGRRDLHRHTPPRQVRPRENS